MNCISVRLWMLRRKEHYNIFATSLLLLIVLVVIFFFKMVLSGTSVGLAFALSIAAGMSTCIGGLTVFSKRLVHLANPKTLSISLSLSAGVMIFISLVEIFGKSVGSYQKGFTVTLLNDTHSCGELGHRFKFISKTDDGGYHCSYCGAICEGYAWLATTATFILGVIIIFAMDYIVGVISPAAHEELEISDMNRLQSHSGRENCKENRETGRKTRENKGTSFGTLKSVDGGLPFGCCEEGLPMKEGLPMNDGLFSNLTKDQLNRTGVLTALAIGLHNIPEGIATYVGAIGDTRVGSALAIGIALHNIPEGIAVATPVYFATGSRLKAFMWTFVSALAEPVGATIAWLIIGEGLNPHVEGIMFGIVCGMMVAISFKELIPNAIKYHSTGNVVVFSIFCGMGIMVLSLILFAFAGVCH